MDLRPFRLPAGHSVYLLLLLVPWRSQKAGSLLNELRLQILPLPETGRVDGNLAEDHASGPQQSCRFVDTER